MKTRREVFSNLSLKNSLSTNLLSLLRIGRTLCSEGGQCYPLFDHDVRGIFTAGTVNLKSFLTKLKTITHSRINWNCQGRSFLTTSLIRS